MSTNEQITDLARTLAIEAAKTAKVAYQNQLLTLIRESLEQGYTSTQIVAALLDDLGRD